MADQAGTAVLQGTDANGVFRKLNIDIFIPDAVNTTIKWNPTGLAITGSPDILVAPVDGAITDIVPAAAPTAVGFTVLLDNAVQNGAAMRHANLLTSLVTRVPLLIPIARGQQIQLLQF